MLLTAKEICSKRHHLPPALERAAEIKMSSSAGAIHSTAVSEVPETTAKRDAKPVNPGEHGAQQGNTAEQCLGDILWQINRLANHSGYDHPLPVWYAITDVC